MFRRFSSGPLVTEIRQISTGEIGEELVFPVRTARVVCANYQAIVHDFPQAFGLGDRNGPIAIGNIHDPASGRISREAIDQWLIRNAAFISEQQAQANSVNSSIDIGAEARRAYRPPEYGRAVVVPVDTPPTAGGAGYLDLKGAGVAPGAAPSHDDYCNGLEYLGYALVDFFYGWLIDTIFARTFPGYSTVPVYAVLDLGFDIVNGWHGTAPAGLHVRRAHARPVPEEYLPMSGSDREKLMVHLELLLRAFGLTTTGPRPAYTLVNEEVDDTLTYKDVIVETTTDLERQKAARIVEAIRRSPGRRLEIMNVQLTSEGSWADKSLEMYDFGHISAYRVFDSPVANLIRNGALSVGRIFEPDDDNFVKPDKGIAVDPDLCDRHTLNAYGFYAAQQFRKPGSAFNQTRIERMMRLIRLKALGRNVAWARRDRT